MEHMEELVRKACGGDKDAFGTLYETVYQDLYRFALYVLKHPQDAQDAVAETVADAFWGIGKLRNPEAFRPWIFKILSNKCKRRLREYAARPGPLKETMQGMEQELEEAVQVRQAFFALEDEERLIVSMKVFGGYQSKEIGKMLHKSHNTVRSRLSRALKKWRGNYPRKGEARWQIMIKTVKIRWKKKSEYQRKRLRFRQGYCRNIWDICWKIRRTNKL